MKFAFIMTLFWSLQSSAGLLYTYKQLFTKDLDQMNKIVNEKVKEAAKDQGDRSIPLKEGLQAVFSRPNDDGMIEKVVTPLRNNLEDMNIWDEVMKSLVKEAIGALGNTKAFTPTVQVTYWIFLENVIAEFQPVLRSDKVAREIVTSISAAKIEISKEAKKERKLTIMKDTMGPTELANQVLAALPPPAAPATK
jgi:hypothetical protein